MCKTVLYVLLFSALHIVVLAQNESLIYFEKVEKELHRVNKLALVHSNQIKTQQGKQLNDIYQFVYPQIIQRIYRSKFPEINKSQQYIVILNYLQQVQSDNIIYTRSISRRLKIILDLQTKNELQAPNTLKNDQALALELIPFYLEKTWAKQLLKEIAQNQPAELLKVFDNIQFVSWAVELIEEVAQVAPFKIQNYLYSNNPVNRALQQSKSPIVGTLRQITSELGTTSRAFVLLYDIHTQKLSIKDAHRISKSDLDFFTHLIDLVKESKFLGFHSVEEALKNIGLRKVREVNDLHDESDAIRFAPVKDLTAEQLYFLMVYSEDEIFTSSFMGLFDRMMNRMTEKSSFEFLFHMNFKRFRTFMKMCAGYNSLATFTNKMTVQERNLLFKKIVEGVELNNDGFESAMALADFYAALKTDEDKKKLQTHFDAYRNSIEYKNPAGYKIYEVLAQVLGFEDFNNSEIIQSTYYFDPNIFLNNNINIQQHFFFDDPDGIASYNSFIKKYRSPNWKIVDNKTYILISSVKGNKIHIYVNKPKTEYAGQDAIADKFNQINRKPDIVVHRGHSYFVNTAIESLTPSSKLVFLGSCGGHNNMRNVLMRAPEAQVIASKQIGTLLVNNSLIWAINEQLRLGKKDSWSNIWIKVEKSLAGNTIALAKFKEYIPPHKNLGLIFLQSMQEMI
jgi:hypothetical protein